ncbi:MAG TPA: D-glycero-beta-D-manno-heptose 1-phosphate adenylyltransferase [Acidobacteriota bacterium]|nr:D-glycero-beta-D-manno-heptose 1-phosphate adenylyltransferase [Acidobacteriota bacterium]
MFVDVAVYVLVDVDGFERSMIRSAKEKICSREQAKRRVEDWKRAGEKVVFTNGCFDLLHPGHVQYLQKARSLGDRLVVAMNDDASVRKIKGAGRPVQPAPERAELLAALAAIDLVTLFAEVDPYNIIRELLPDILVKGADWPVDQIIGHDLVEAAGGKVMQIQFEPGYSTTQLIETIRKNFS